MTKLWIDVLLLQTLILVTMVCVGRILGLRWRSALLAVTLALPAPLFKVSPGTAGLVFPADLVAGIFVFQWFFGTLRARQDCERPPTKFVVVAALILVLLPSLSTFMGYVLFPEANRGLNYVVASTVRQICYLVVFWGMGKKMQWEERPDRFVVVQCLTFAAVAICGLLQYTGRADLDLWYEIVGRDPTQAGYGGGFMGMYRGAIGAYGVGIIAALTIAMPRVVFGVIWAPVMAATIVGMMLAVGTRQGVAIGVFAFLVGLVISVRSNPAGSRLTAFFKAIGVLLMVCILVMAATKIAFPASFEKWVTKRFSGFESFGSLVELAQKRDVYGMSWAIRNLEESRLMMFFGLGHGTESRMGAIFVKYGDHELLNVWQVGGLPLLLLYILFLLMLLVRFRWYKRLTDPANRAYVAAAFAVLFSSLPLLYGHFFILDAHAANAPVGYWHWALFGGALGILARPDSRGRRGDYVMYPVVAMMTPPRPIPTKRPLCHDPSNSNT